MIFDICKAIYCAPYVDRTHFFDTDTDPDPDSDLP